MIVSTDIVAMDRFRHIYVRPSSIHAYPITHKNECIARVYIRRGMRQHNALFTLYGIVLLDAFIMEMITQSCECVHTKCLSGIIITDTESLNLFQ